MNSKKVDWPRNPWLKDLPEVRRVLFDDESESDSNLPSPPTGAKPSFFVQRILEWRQQILRHEQHVDALNVTFLDECIALNQNGSVSPCA